jgi:Sap, sulfolipid-1-addressing protein
VLRRTPSDHEQIGDRVLLQAAGLALLASISPTALLIAATFLGSAQPRLTAAYYLCGAVVMSLVMGIVILVVLRSADLSRRAEHTPRYGLRLGLGVLLLAAAVAVARRKARPSDQDSSPG